LIIIVAQQRLHLHLMDDVTTYMKIPEVFNLSNKANSKEGYSIKFNKLFY